MSQFSIFFVPVKGDERSEEALNLCLRTRRVLQVERHVFPDGWTFCVEWLDGEGGVKAPFVRNPQRVDYRDVLPEPVFVRFAKLRSFRKELAQTHGVIWQKESWDTLVQNQRHFDTVLNYIRGNDLSKAWSVYG